MKLHRLELEGFGPFREKQVVDFDAFAADGIFLITGRTGAGKSSVLDGVCYALYGGVPRYDGAERRLRSDHCAPEDPTRVSVEFTADERRWRVTRSPEYERPKLRGGGFTTEKHQASLEVFTDAGWTGVAARPVDVATHLDELLGLTQQQFLQVILLAQNRFARFLLAKNDERQGLLRTLFGTKSFEDYARDLDERRKAAHDRLTAEGGEVATLLDEAERMVAELDERTAEAGDAVPAADPSALTPSDRLSAVVWAIERIDYRVDVLARERDAAATALDAALDRQRAAEAQHTRQVERVRVRDTLAALEAEEPTVAQHREELAAALAAEALRAPVDAVARAAGALDRARDVARRATTALVDSGEDRADARDDDAAIDERLRSRDDELTGILGRCDEAAATETAAAEAAAEARVLDAAVSAAEEEQRLLAARRAAVPASLRSLDERLAALAGAGDRHEHARATLADARERQAAARDAERLASEREQADLVALVRADELQQAVEAWAALLRRRLAGAAGELARELVAGEPCRVCGSSEHPHPATVDAAHVTDEEVERAERRKDRAMEAERLASDAARVARDTHALAAARAGGEGVEVWALRAAEAETAAARAAEDVAAEQRARTERAQLAELDAAAAEEAERLAGDLAEQRQRQALVRQRADDLRSELVDARGAFASVAERRADAARRRDAVRALRAARVELDARERSAVEAADDLAARVGASVFSDVVAATAALRDDAARGRLEADIRRHEAAETAARGRLLELELALVDVPDEPVDLAPVAAAVAEARAAVDTATAAHAAAAGAVERLRSLAQRADAGHDAVARLADAHAVISRLANTVAGRAPNTHRMTLETFVLAAELEEIVAAANLRLDQMSAGRYRLQHTDALAARGAASGLGIEIMDAFTGQCRPPQSLSGGETFLASLALALGLAEVVTARAGGIRLDTLFIDEGFGSLDDDTLDLAMRALDELRQGGRTVGVISHVAAMKDQLPAQLRVTATPRGPSTISQDAGVLA